jgi:hypothetical protein
LNFIRIYCSFCSICFDGGGGGTGNTNDDLATMLFDFILFSFSAANVDVTSFVMTPSSTKDSKRNLDNTANIALIVKAIESEKTKTTKMFGVSTQQQQTQ